jgi:2-polyprenyl-6-methoxyphenol hydroxylase-like FAD-dependent oxidoreductase
MKIAILGGGPSGLYCAYLLKRARPETSIQLVEQNPADATFGFGVVFSEQALGFLAKDDPDTHAAITPHMEAWNDLTVVHREDRIAIDGVGFTAIGRLKLLRLLQERARSVGVVPVHGQTVTSLDAFADADLIIGADGVNSLVRNTHAQQFGATLTWGSNRFIWYGVDKAYPTLTQTFRETDFGALTVHHYRYEPARSTFLVEVDAQTWERAGIAGMNSAQSRELCESVFAPELDGRPLLSNKSEWRRFPKVHNRRWSVDNQVLLGDALHTAHFSIGSGTRMAMEDAIALVKSIAQHPNDLRDALAAYEAIRRPVVEKLVAAAEASLGWYEDMATHMTRSPLEFAHSYITRSGRLDDARLGKMSPRFMRAYLASHPNPS